MAKITLQKSIENDFDIVMHNHRLFSLFNELNSRGYFPKQLPPPFHTLEFSRVVAENTTQIYALANEHIFSSRRINSTKLYRYSYARPRQLRRIFSVPNPVSIIPLHVVTAANWELLSTTAQKTSVSLSKPEWQAVWKFGPYTSTQSDDFSTGDEAHHRGCLNFSHTWDDLSERKLEIRRAAKFTVKADIARFYPTIYTHIIPWIIEGKASAKQQRNDFEKLGNRLDALIRHSQDGQTLGIPIGPDFSFLISECILSVIDEELAAKLKGVDYKLIRRVDDYEFACFNRLDADKCLAVLQEVLLKYELELNTHKSLILELPQPLQPPEFFHLRTFNFTREEISNLTPESGIIQDKLTLLNFIDLAFQSYNEHPKGVLKFAIKKADGKKNPELYVNFICQCMLLEPGCIDTALFKVAGLNLWHNESIIKSFIECFERIIIEHSELGHSSEVAWALWGFILFKHNLPERAVKAISNMNDSVVLLLAMDATKKGFIKGNLIQKRVNILLSEDLLLDEQWLLAYEAEKRGWISRSNPRYIPKNSFFQFLKQKKVSFYNTLDVELDRKKMKHWEPDYGYGPEPEGYEDESLDDPF